MNASLVLGTLDDAVEALARRAAEKRAGLQVPDELTDKIHALLARPQPGPALLGLSHMAGSATLGAGVGGVLGAGVGGARTWLNNRRRRPEDRNSVLSGAASHGLLGAGLGGAVGAASPAISAMMHAKQGWELPSMADVSKGVSDASKYVSDTPAVSHGILGALGGAGIGAGAAAWNNKDKHPAIRQSLLSGALTGGLIGGGIGGGIGLARQGLNKLDAPPPASTALKPPIKFKDSAGKEWAVPQDNRDNQAAAALAGYGVLGGASPAEIDEIRALHADKPSWLARTGKGVGDAVRNSARSILPFGESILGEPEGLNLGLGDLAPNSTRWLPRIAAADFLFHNKKLNLGDRTQALAKRIPGMPDVLARNMGLGAIDPRNSRLLKDLAAGISGEANSPSSAFNENQQALLKDLNQHGQEKMRAAARTGTGLSGTVPVESTIRSWKHMVDPVHDLKTGDPVWERHPDGRLVLDTAGNKVQEVVRATREIETPKITPTHTEISPQATRNLTAQGVAAQATGAKPGEAGHPHVPANRARVGPFDFAHRGFRGPWQIGGRVAGYGALPLLEILTNSASFAQAKQDAADAATKTHAYLTGK